MKELLARLKSRPAIFSEMIAASLLANILALATPLFVIQVLNRYIAHGVDATLATLAIGTVIAILLEFGFRQVRLRLAASVNAPFNRELTNSAFAVLTGAKSAAGEAMAPGLRQQIVSGADTIQTTYAAPNVAALFDVPFVLIFVAVLFLLSPTLAVIVAVFLVAVFAVALMTMATLRAPTRDMLTSGGRRGTLIGAAITAADTVRAFNAQDFINRQWRNESALFQRLHRIVMGRQGVVQTLSISAQGLMSVAVIATGAVLVVQGRMDVGSMIGANILAARALGPLIKLAQMSESFVKARQALALLHEFSKIPRERTEGSALGEYSGALEFQDLGFAHPGQRTPLFESMSLKLEPKALLVVAGSNGAGKTTLARLIVGLLEPTRGKILANGVDLAQIVPEWWRKQIVYLPQEPGFLNATIRDNLLAGNPDLDDGALNDLAHAAGLKSFIDQSPEGFDTPLTANGANLSLGIRRRLALARALATDGTVMLVDEPTEGLDNEGAQAVIAAMTDHSKRGRTVIAFSHDPNILEAAPQFVDLNVKPVPTLVRKRLAASSSELASATEIPVRKVQT
ncbi:MAG: ATP-binding cassette domain-containing protein [Rhodospirillales bacterium]|nr:ATP-binding cassette domain-containing protein [Rhodospirillales bacterium]